MLPALPTSLQSMNACAAYQLHHSACISHVACRLEVHVYSLLQWPRFWVSKQTALPLSALPPCLVRKDQCKSTASVSRMFVIAGRGQDDCHSNSQAVSEVGRAHGLTPSRAQLAILSTL